MLGVLFWTSRFHSQNRGNSQKSQARYLVRDLHSICRGGGGGIHLSCFKVATLLCDNDKLVKCGTSDKGVMEVKENGFAI